MGNQLFAIGQRAKKQGVSIAALNAKTISVGLCAVMLSACASGATVNGKSAGKKEYRDAIGVSANQAVDTSKMDPVAAAAYWGTQYEREPNNPDVAVEYSASLRKLGSVAEAVTVATNAAAKEPDNANLRVEAGKALLESGRAFEAVRYLEEAAAQQPDNWRTLSAYGVALDQIGEHELARVKYDEALMLAPRAATLLNNKGLSYALSGDLGIAARTLRAAASGPGGDARVRQNLALVLALKGDLMEAERLARSDLPPQVADQNIAYFRSLMNQPAYWQELAGDNYNTPEFEPVSVPVKPEATPKSPEAAPTPKPQPLPQLREEPKPLDEDADSGPVALIKAAPVTNASAEVGADETDEKSVEEKTAAPEEAEDVQGVNLKD